MLLLVVGSSVYVFPSLRSLGIPSTMIQKAEGGASLRHAPPRCAQARGKTHRKNLGKSGALEKSLPVSWLADQFESPQGQTARLFVFPSPFFPITSAVSSPFRRSYALRSRPASGQNAANSTRALTARTLRPRGSTKEKPVWRSRPLVRLADAIE